MVTNDGSRYKDQRGVVKDILKANILFLWDQRFLNQSNGIFVEHARSVTHQGYDLLKSDGGQNAPGIANPSRIGKHPLLNKTVQIVKGSFKGQMGRVTHVNGHLAKIEISTRAKQENIALDNLREVTKDRDQSNRGGHHGDYRQGGRGPQGAGGYHGRGGPHGSPSGGDQTNAGG